MNTPRKSYATKAKVNHAVEMARLAGIEEVGSIEFRPDGSIRIERATPTDGAPPSVEDEISAWRRKRGK